MRHGRMLRGTAALGAALLIAGCTAQPGPGDWTLEPITMRFANGELTDFAFGMHELAADGRGGFWAVSGTTWLHVGADGETRDVLVAEPDTLIGTVDHIAAYRSDTLVVAFGGAGIAHDASDAGAASGIRPPSLGVLDTAMRQIRTIPTPFMQDPHVLFARVLDLAVHDETAFLALQQVAATPGSEPTLDIFKVPLDGTLATVLHSEAFVPDLPQEVLDAPVVSITTGADGTIFVATLAEQFALDAAGAELWRDSQTVKRPIVAAGRDGSTLWWGGSAQASSESFVLVGGSADARRTIEGHTDCTDSFRKDALTLRTAEATHPLPFLCGANAATWVDDAWIIAIGGEGDGVLVRVTQPQK